jgi:glucosamine--fructose-6-phosphate aminotransferase (isomerizing)
MMALLKHLQTDLLAELVIISNATEAQTIADSPIHIPAEVPEWLSPLVAIVPAQLFAFHLTRIKGFDANKPRSISKVTETR